MPEIGEVARAVHYIRKHLVGRTLHKVTAKEDANIFGKVGTSHTEIMHHLTGKKVLDAAQQGKYFWMIMDGPKHPVMHFGMAGWFRLKSEDTFYYRRKESEEEWPPKYWKILFETDDKGGDKVEAAYVDLRRFGRVRLVDCPGNEIRRYSPLKENGPDPVQDKEIVTTEWLKDLCQQKKVPIKALLLDQANISGIGNWVGDEILYHARIHPEQYCNTLSDEELPKLHKSLHYVCGTAVDLLSDSDRFPEDWLFKHRWSKGKKDAKPTLANGEKIVFLTVGGRTSAIVPSVQKKTGPVAKEVSDTEKEETPLGVEKHDTADELRPSKSVTRKKRKMPGRAVAQEDGSAPDDEKDSKQLSSISDGHDEAHKTTKLPKKARGRTAAASSGAVQDERPVKKAKRSSATAEDKTTDGSRRRSGRLQR